MRGLGRGRHRSTHCGIQSGKCPQCGAAAPRTCRCQGCCCLSRAELLMLLPLITSAAPRGMRLLTAWQSGAAWHGKASLAYE